jgi:hypothetical protein
MDPSNGGAQFDARGHLIMEGRPLRAECIERWEKFRVKYLRQLRRKNKRGELNAKIVKVEIR